VIWTDKLIEWIAIRRTLADLLARDDADEVLAMIAENVNRSPAASLLFEVWTQRWN
jgi:hypothetical protein